jgi:hypothetical protein
MLAQSPVLEYSTAVNQTPDKLLFSLVGLNSLFEQVWSKPVSGWARLRGGDRLSSTQRAELLKTLLTLPFPLPLDEGESFDLTLKANQSEEKLHAYLNLIVESLFFLLRTPRLFDRYPGSVNLRGLDEQGRPNVKTLEHPFVGRIILLLALGLDRAGVVIGAFDS